MTVETPQIETPVVQQVETPAAPSATPETPPEFTLPDAYKEKSWAAKVKSQEDVYKLVDNLNGLVGKKSVPFDYENADAEAIKAYHASIAPKDLAAYEFLKADDPVSKAIGEAFMSHGITSHQGKAIVQSLAPMLAEMDASQKAELHDGNKYAEMSKAAFGDNYEEAIKTVNKVLVDHVPKEVGAAFDAMPNAQRHAVDVAISKIVTSYEGKLSEMAKQYGIKETGAQAGGGLASAAVDPETARKELRAQIRALDNAPHSAAKKQELVNRLTASYKGA